MSRWVELAATLDDGARTCANSAISANSGANAGSAPPNGTNDTNGTAALPASILSGLAALERRAVPRIARPEVWPEIVADSLRIASEGWAAQALALGWSPLDLWGCSPESGGNDLHDGLAVVLASRRLALLDCDRALIVSGRDSREVFTVRRMNGAVLLWELGNGR